MPEKSPERDFLEFVLNNLLDFPEKITIEEIYDDLGLLFEVTVQEEDMGKIIGKGGQTIQSLRTILRLMGSKRKERVNLKVLEPSK
jgi:predicted RNA-binding protein YlqC (UPF0109 family)